MTKIFVPPSTTHSEFTASGDVSVWKYQVMVGGVIVDVTVNQIGLSPVASESLAQVIADVIGTKLRAGQ